MSKQRPPFQPSFRVAPPAELSAYVVYEHQLDSLAQGTVSSLMLNFALFFLGVSATALGTLVSIPKESDRAYYTFLIVALMFGIAGVVLLGLWWKTHKSVARLVAEIKSQMPPSREAQPEPDVGTGQS